MRGRVAKESLNRFDGGITPTYAGKRLLFPDRGATPWNYPHVRGEEDLTTPRDYARPELPPRTRGRGVRGCAACRIIRITPTYAGKSFGALTPIIYPWNYPHVRGEELKRRYHFFLNPELPPRTRGRACLTWLFTRGRSGNLTGIEFQIYGSLREIPGTPVLRVSRACQFPHLKFSLLRPACRYRTQGGRF